MKKAISLIRYALTDSTNARAKEYIKNGNEPLPALFVADEQSAGRGRMGRSFYSPAGTGLYATLLFAAPESEDRLLSLTSLAAVAAAEAIDELLGVSVEIKWVNDLYKNGRKVAGILAESFERCSQRYIALGIGINLSTSDFPDELASKAGSLSSQSISRERADELALLFSERLLSFLLLEDTSPVIDTYRKSSCVIGRKISFLYGGKETFGTATGITPLGALTVFLDSGGEITLSTGEISIFLQ
jgi:BirA family biotin operon repressor/biotin-[acetyl-CoA-carboxylase] ligase